ncbi:MULTISPECIES: aldo/keto reductase [unclassified Streptomyces]|uniref:aldo/keto reductase n=1 Tax=unclassified Streptomyces TaxID=2593676 RepID=UPI001BE5DF6F|nr:MULTISPECIES: aldo/keto reductase [unclassified Streptomyces]MBT2405522.1 aldo/keto reductase [Streptomyces sp. ISL-21]MBT2454441.1 aldo/keto reductase [Streptomyces sp. ISL-86]MBT2607799.1 aldo/keto reductase [Streptomyces sp. ISL-87]
MRQVTLGSQGLKVSQQGLGCMGMSQSYGVGNDVESIRTIHRALELGVTLIDTANVYGATGLYGVGANEKLVGHALRERRDEVVLATKCGIVDVKPGAGMQLRGDAEYVRRCCDESLQRLGVDHIDLYYLHRVDPKVPVEESIGAMSELVAAGKIRYVGVSELPADELERAHAVHPITAVQSEYSLWSRGLEEAVLPTARRLGIGLVPFSPLGRGFLTGSVTSRDELDANDMRRGMPRFEQHNLDANQRIVDIIKTIAAEKDVLPGQIALAWVHAQGHDIVPIPGTKRVSYLEQNTAAAGLELSQDDLTRLGAVAAGTSGAHR